MGVGGTRCDIQLLSFLLSFYQQLNPVYEFIRLSAASGLKKNYKITASGVPVSAGSPPVLEYEGRTPVLEGRCVCRFKASLGLADRVCGLMNDNTNTLWPSRPGVRLLCCQMRCVGNGGEGVSELYRPLGASRKRECIKICLRKTVCAAYAWGILTASYPCHSLPHT